MSMLWMTSLPADAGKLIKAAYKKEVPRGLDFSITKARKPEWLAENLDNPFRDWDGREQITAANAKKSAQLYKKNAGNCKNTGWTNGHRYSECNIEIAGEGIYRSF
ncbi:hypothetical protein [Paenibacillus sp. 8b26]|uniref:hypothetical protein n=1 Tax=Paenibacillus sp. 8b26 TaxID=3424133 RepID=UPI003D65C80B